MASSTAFNCFRSSSLLDAAALFCFPLSAPPPFTFSAAAAFSAAKASFDAPPVAARWEAKTAAAVADPLDAEEEEEEEYFDLESGFDDDFSG